MRDPWGHPYYATFNQTAMYSDRVNVYNYASYGEKPQQKVDLKPVTQFMNHIYLRSGGQTPTVGTADDFNVATFTRLTAEQAGNESDSTATKTRRDFAGLDRSDHRHRH